MSTETKTEARIAALEAEVAALVDALRTISSYDQNSPHGEGICPYGCDCPAIARRALEARMEATA